MLKSLQILDYALIEKINVEFGKGLNIITGETGAGKSILIDALGLLLGERASNEVIRKGALKAVIEGIFDVHGNKKLKKMLDENEIEFYPELILRREISVKGSRCFINDSPVPLSILKDAGDLLVDLHGQHEHQSLLRTETHIEMLDEFGDIHFQINNYKEKFEKLLSLISELESLKEKEFFLKEKKELFSFQIKEIDAVSPEEGEEEKLENELNILENSERLSSISNNIYENLYETDTSIYDSLVNIKVELNELLGIDKSFTEINEECQTALTLISDIAEFIRTYKERIDLDPDRLDLLRERLKSISLLKKKYGGSIKYILDYRKKIGEEYNIAENFSERIILLQEEIEFLRAKCGEQAALLSIKRNEIANRICSEVITVLNHLGIDHPVFQVRITQKPAENNSSIYLIQKGKEYKCNSNGFDEIEFCISTNKGEDPKPLVKVASGGEISRIMLALKTILAKNDKLPLLIFDEIDTGVSGRIAQKVGQTLKSLAEYHQIISITHLPQIAGLADHHYLVEKKLTGDRITSSIKKLNDEDRIREIAKLLSGEEITETSLKGARELMK